MEGAQVTRLWVTEIVLNTHDFQFLLPQRELLPLLWQAIFHLDVLNVLRLKWNNYYQVCWNRSHIS